MTDQFDDTVQFDEQRASDPRAHCSVRFEGEGRARAAGGLVIVGARASRA